MRRQAACSAGTPMRQPAAQPRRGTGLASQGRPLSCIRRTRSGAESPLTNKAGSAAPKAARRRADLAQAVAAAAQAQIGHHGARGLACRARAARITSSPVGAGEHATQPQPLQQREHRIADLDVVFDHRHRQAVQRQLGSRALRPARRARHWPACRARSACRGRAECSASGNFISRARRRTIARPRPRPLRRSRSGLPPW